VRRAGNAADVGHVTPKMLRKTLATAYADAQVERHVAASITGDLPTVYDKHYGKTRRDRLERESAVKRLLYSGDGAK